MKDKEEILKERLDKGKEIFGILENFRNEPFKSYKKIIAIVDLAYQQGKADKAKEVEEILSKKRKEAWDTLHAREAWAVKDEVMMWFADLKQELNNFK